MSTISINVNVNNTQSSARLKQLHNQVRRVGTATKQTKNHFKDFNQTMFGATAFVGMFTQAFGSLARTMMDGSELDRAGKQFSKRFGSELPAQMKKFDDGTTAVIGPQGRFIQNIRAMTTNSIDMMAAMRSAIQLRASGVSGDIDVLSEIVVRAGTAAKMAGKDSAEGIRRVTDFLKDGSLAHLQHLGLLREVNPELKAQLAILGKASGVLGTAVTASFKLALGMKILREATKGQLKGQRDLRDTLQDTAQYFDLLRRTVGTFLGTAVQPLLESFIDFAVNARVILEDIKANKKAILFLAKAFIIGTAAVSGFVLVVGGLRLAVKALSSLVGGIPFLTLALTALGAAVIYNKTSMTGLIDIAQTLGAVVQGSFQLINSFLSDPENFAKGIGKMDASIHKLLKSKGLLGLVQNIGRVGSIITVFVRSTVKSFLSTLDSMLSKLGSVGDKIKNFLGLNTGAWKRDWLGTAKTFGEAFGKITVGVLGLWGALKLLKAGKALLGGVPILGKLFGGGGSGGNNPKGTKSDPIYVTDIGAMLGGAAGGLGGLAKAGGKKMANMLGITYASKYMRVMGKKSARDGTKLLKKSGKWAVDQAKHSADLSSRIVRSNFDRLGGNRAIAGTKSGAKSLAGKLGAGSRIAASAAFGPRYVTLAQGKATLGKMGGGVSKGGGALGKMFKVLAAVGKPVVSVLARLFPAFRLVGTVISSIARFTLIGTVITVVATTLAGIVAGLLEARQGIADFITAFSTMIGDLFETNVVLKGVSDGFSWIAAAVKDIFNEIYLIGKGMGIVFGEWLGSMGAEMHQKTIVTRDTKATQLIKDGKVTGVKGTLHPKTGQAIMPSMEGLSHAGKMGTIRASFEMAADTERKKMRDAYFEALELHSPGDANITKEEWIEIYAAGMDKSKLLRENTDNTGKTEANTGDGIIGSARQGGC